MSDSLRAKLAPIYGPLLSDFFDRPAVSETRATCDDCAMCDKGTGELVAMSYFRPDLKCCTFHPHLPNYLVGALLADRSDELAEGRERIRKKIATRIGVTPFYVAAPRKFNVLYEAGRNGGFFGRSDALLCPYFDRESGGRCTVWRYREAVCTTFFCKYERGVKGLGFWSALKDYLLVTEFLLARDAATKVDPKVEEPKLDRNQLTIEDLEDRPPDDYAKIWGKWVGREAEFYVECQKRVRALRRRDFRAIVDELPDVKKRLDAVKQNYEALTSNELPARLVRNSQMREVFAKDQVAVTPYNRMDSFALDKDLYDVLGTLRAEESLDENLARLAKDGIELTPELLVALYVQGVLVAPRRPAQPQEAKADAAPGEAVGLPTAESAGRTDDAGGAGGSGSEGGAG
jgi:hypothetical protein